MLIPGFSTPNASYTCGWRLISSAALHQGEQAENEAVVSISHLFSTCDASSDMIPADVDNG